MIELNTVATNKLLCLKNAGAQISKFFLSQMNNQPPLQLKKNQNPWGRFGATS